MIRILALALALFLVLPTAPAVADCDDFATTPLASFREIDARRGTFVMAVGAFSDGAVLDEIYALASDGSETSTRLIDGRFEGLSAGPDGFTVTMSIGLEIAQRCNAAGCQPQLDGTRYLVFLERVRGRYEFAEDGCAFRAFKEPDPRVLGKLIACVGGDCE